YRLKDNFVAENDSAVLRYAKDVSADADSLDISGLKLDQANAPLGESLPKSISAEAQGLLGEKDISGQRKSFEMISNQLYALIRVVRYDRQVIYHDYCPMAFGEQGATWLSDSAGIRNPYIPK